MFIGEDRHKVQDKIIKELANSPNSCTGLLVNFTDYKKFKVVDAEDICKRLAYLSIDCYYVVTTEHIAFYAYNRKWGTMREDNRNPAQDLATQVIHREKEDRFDKLYTSLNYFIYNSSFSSDTQRLFTDVVGYILSNISSAFFDPTKPLYYRLPSGVLPLCTGEEFSSFTSYLNTEGIHIELTSVSDVVHVLSYTTHNNQPIDIKKAVPALKVMTDDILHVAYGPKTL